LRNHSVSYTVVGMSDIDLKLSRRFNGAADLLYRGWTESAYVERWWGPSGFTCPIAEMDVRVGGVSLVCMRAPRELGGVELFNTWSYSVVEPGRRLEFVLRFTNAKREAVSPQTLGIPTGVPGEVPHVLTFIDLPGGMSELVVEERGYATAEAVEMSRVGLSQTLDKLAAAVGS
jgi:uncharacterized protein YndB with AHSA1/START domain